MGLTHFDTAPTLAPEVGHIRGRWTLLGEGAGSSIVGVRRMQLSGHPPRSIAIRPRRRSSSCLGATAS